MLTLLTACFTLFAHASPMAEQGETLDMTLTTWSRASAPMDGVEADPFGGRTCDPADEPLEVGFIYPALLLRYYGIVDRGQPDAGLVTIGWCIGPGTANDYIGRVTETAHADPVFDRVEYWGFQDVEPGLIRIAFAYRVPAAGVVRFGYLDHAYDDLPFEEGSELVRYEEWDMLGWDPGWANGEVFDFFDNPQAVAPRAVWIASSHLRTGD